MNSYFILSKSLINQIHCQNLVLNLTIIHIFLEYIYDCKIFVLILDCYSNCYKEQPMIYSLDFMFIKKLMTFF